MPPSPRLALIRSVWQRHFAQVLPILATCGQGGVSLESWGHQRASPKSVHGRKDSRVRVEQWREGSQTCECRHHRENGLSQPSHSVLTPETCPPIKACRAC